MTTKGSSLRYALWVWSYCWIGSLLNSMEWNLTVAMLPSMTEDLGISLLVMGTLLGIRRFIRLPASWFSGWLAERYGRAKELIVGSALFMLATLLFSLSWDFFSLLVFTFLVEFSWEPTSILLAEHAPAKHRGWLVGCANAFAFGATFGPILGAFMMNSGYSWRVAYLVLTVSAALHLVQGFFVRESERYIELKKVRDALKRGEKISESDLKYSVDIESAKHLHVRQLFRRDLAKISVLYALFMGCSSVFALNGPAYWTTYFPAEKGVTYQQSLVLHGLLWAISEPAYLISSFSSQIIGRNLMMKIGLAVCAVGNFAMVQFAYGFDQILLISAIMMVGAGLVYGTLPAFYVECFPTRVRAIARAWNTTVASIVQLITLPLMAYLAPILGWSLVYQLFITTAPSVAVIILFFLPSPKPKLELEELTK